MDTRSIKRLPRWAGLFVAMAVASVLAASFQKASADPGRDFTFEKPGAERSAQQAPIPVAFTIGSPDRGDTPLNRKRLQLDAIPDAVIGAFKPNTHLKVCYPTLSNAPSFNNAKYVRHYRPFVIARGRVVLATAPVNDACMSSGFGPRFGRIHKGVDFSARKHSPIHAAAPGTVMEAGWARGYGKMIVIDHGHGVFTRYAHLNRIERGIKPGAKLSFGEVVGTMGNTGNSTGVHLHYEVLTGTWGPRKAYGLAAHNPLDLPAYTPARTTVTLTINTSAAPSIAR
ncbi:MAG: M23 family metallopeptidase [Pseudomonadota bacterium]